MMHSHHQLAMMSLYLLIQWIPLLQWTTQLLRKDQVDGEDVCKAFIEQTCGCKKASGKPCSGQFSLSYYIKWRAQASLLSQNELDLVMLGSIMATTRSDEDIIHGRYKPVKRQATCKLLTQWMCSV